MATTADLLNALSRHQGREQGIAACDLARLLGVRPRRLRKLLSAVRDEGIAVCGTPASGYYLPLTAEELQQSCAFLERRALHSMRLLSRMKKVSLPDLLGQLRLNQA